LGYRASSFEKEFLSAPIHSPPSLVANSVLQVLVPGTSSGRRRTSSEAKSNKYQPPVAGLLENYESDSLVEANEDTDPEVGNDAANRLEASSAAKPRYKTRAGR
jgi:hypothetical protein